MKIRTVFSTIDDVPRERLDTLCDLGRLRAFGYNAQFAPLGTEITVYAVEFVDGNIFYRIGDQPNESYTILCLAALTEIVDGRISSYWECRTTASGLVIGPPSWMIDCFHDRLSDGEAGIVSDFEQLRQLMKEESAIPKTA